MKKTLLLALATMAAMTASASNSPYISRVYDYLPAPGQFVNVFPAYKPGYTQDSINAQLETSLCGGANGSVSLGSYGGYIVFGFDHPVVNKHTYDVKIYGNAFQSAAVPNQAGGSRKHVKVECKTAQTYNVLKSQSKDVVRELVYDQFLYAPISQGDVLGHLRYSISGIVIADYPITATEDIRSVTNGWFTDYIKAIRERAENS